MTSPLLNLPCGRGVRLGRFHRDRHALVDPRLDAGHPDRPQVIFLARIRAHAVDLRLGVVFSRALGGRRRNRHDGRNEHQHQQTRSLTLAVVLSSRHFLFLSLNRILFRSLRRRSLLLHLQQRLALLFLPFQRVAANGRSGLVMRRNREGPVQRRSGVGGEMALNVPWCRPQGSPGALPLGRRSRRATAATSTSRNLASSRSASRRGTRGNVARGLALRRGR